MVVCVYGRAIDSEVIIGYVVVIDNLVHIMMVSPEQQHKGIGARLLSFAETKIHSDDLKPTLETFETNTQAMNFYLKMDGLLLVRSLILILALFEYFLIKKTNQNRTS